MNISPINYQINTNYKESYIKNHNTSFGSAQNEITNLTQNIASKKSSKLKNLLKLISKPFTTKPKTIPPNIDRNMYWTMNKKSVVAQAFRYGNPRKGVTYLTAENSKKVLSHLKEHNLRANLNDLRIITFEENSKPAFKISYFDKRRRKSYIFLNDGTPDMILSYKRGLTGSINGAKVEAIWKNNENRWVHTTHPSGFPSIKRIYDGDYNHYDY